MRITSLVDHAVCGCCTAEFGLSLHIETDSGPVVLFDMGQGDVFARNAGSLGIDLSQVDMAVVSHGHYDHGGGLGTFLRINDKAPVYVAGDAFDAHYSLRPEGTAFIGLDPALALHGRLVRVDAVARPAPGMTLFSRVTGPFPLPAGSDRLLGPDCKTPDDFAHEQSLLIEDGDLVVLFGGCAHAGLVNIMRRAEQLSGRRLTHVFSGMHLMKAPQEPGYLDALADALCQRLSCRYYTMHCTGQDQAALLAARMPDRLTYLPAGGWVEI